MLFYARRYYLNSSVIQNCVANWKGQGFEEQAGTNDAAAGTWFDIGTAFVGKQVTPITITSGSGSVFEDFAVAEPSQPRPPVANYDTHFPASSATPHITSYTPESWTPAAFDYVFSITGSPGNLFRHVMLDGVTRGFHVDHSGRTNFIDIRGQVFETMFDIHESYDVSRITDVHNWPYWSTADPVMTYDQSHADVIRSYRSDSPFWDGIFGFGVRSVVTLLDDPDGTTTGLQAGRISCDSAVYCLKIHTTGPAQVTGQIGSMRTFGQRWSSVFPVTPTQYPGSSMIELDSSAVLQIGSMENFGTDVATFDFNAPRAPANIMVGSLFVHANAMARNSFLAKFPTAPDTIASLLSIGTTPAIAGTMEGFRETNLAPNGAGIGMYKYPGVSASH